MSCKVIKITLLCAEHATIECVYITLTISTNLMCENRIEIKLKNYMVTMSWFYDIDIDNNCCIHDQMSYRDDCIW